MKAIWKLEDLPKKKNGYKVYSCFACGGGSTMGYKLAGYDVIGANDIDPEMAKIYQKNHNPKHYHLMDIRSLVKEKDLPKEMFELDILDGSPPLAKRKDLKLPKINLNFKEDPVYFRDIRTDTGIQRPMNPETKMYKLWKNRKKTDSNFSTIAKRIMGKESYFSETIIHDDTIPPTIVSGSAYYLYDKAFDVSSNDLISIQSFPQDYDFIKNSYTFIKYVLGMSVPPLMTYGVAKEVEKQLLNKL